MSQQKRIASLLCSTRSLAGGYKEEELNKFKERAPGLNCYEILQKTLKNRI